MTDRNVFCVDRGIWTHPDFDDEVFTQREAWMWLVGEAAWKERRTRGQGGAIMLSRGQLSHSIRFMAEAWGWHRSRVERFIDKLVSRDMVERRIETGQLLLTICNYERFQLGGEVDRDTTETPVETRPRQERDRSETNKNQETKKPDSLPSVVAADEDDDIQLPPIHPATEPTKPQKVSLRDIDPMALYRAAGGKIAKPKTAAAAPTPEESDFDALWLIFPKRPNNPRKPALQAYLRARRNGATHAEIMAGAQALAAEWRKRPKAELQYCPQATTWLNQERWKDVAQPVQAEPAGSPGAMDGMWRDLVTRYRTPRKEWPMGMGPAPDQPGCRAPVHILAEFGYNVAA